ncbi:hypothetical protein SAMN04487950_3366 [Halogranum rubrum]|uniref:Uncharacterized protein n=1 Tax=Halogranum rubrum TaxID=553466 RepID=A0A1I4GRK2_9EURY|nr:hypothetical protein SAMN04487950_3366 [Halogranum rubrum]
MTTHPDEADTADGETSSNREGELRTESASPTSRRSILAALAAAGLASVVGTGTASAQADLDKDGILSGRRNQVLGRFPVVAGGLENQALDSFAVVGGGRNNRAGSDGSDPNSAPYATVSGGLRNLAYQLAVVGGGRGNKATASRGCFVGYRGRFQGCLIWLVVLHILHLIRCPLFGRA